MEIINGVDQDEVGGTTTDTVLRDGSLALTSDWDIGDTRKILTDEIRARDAAGLKLHDDSSNGIFVKDGGNVGIGTDAPDGKLYVDSSTDVYDIVSLQRTDGKFMSLGAGATGTLLTFDSTGYFSFASSGNRAGSVGVTSRMYVTGGGDVAIGGSITAVTMAGATLSAKSNGKVGIGTTSPTAVLDVNNDILRLRTAKTPATAGADGNQGDICWDADYLYVCTATNTWKRSGLSTW